MKNLFKTLLLTSFLLSFATTIFVVFLPSYFHELGLTYAEIGIALAAVNLVAAILSLYVGYLEEKIAKIKLLVLSYFGYVLLPIFYLLANSFASVLLVRFYDGAMSALRYVAKYSLLESKKAYDTGVNVSLNDSISFLGSLLGPIIAGVLILDFGMPSMFFLAFIITLPMALFSLRMLKYSKVHFNKKAKFSPLLKKAFHNKALLMLSFIFLLFAAIDASKFMAIPLYMKLYGFDQFLIGIVGSSFFFFTFLFELFSGYMETNKRRNIFLSAGLLLCALSIFLFITIPMEFAYLLLLALLFSLGTALVRPAIFSDLVAVNHTHPNIGTGVLLFFANIGAVLGLLVSGFLVEVSFDSFFIFAGFVLVITAFLSMFYLKIKAD